MSGLSRNVGPTLAAAVAAIERPPSVPAPALSGSSGSESGCSRAKVVDGLSMKLSSALV